MKEVIPASDPLMIFWPVAWAGVLAVATVMLWKRRRDWATRASFSGLAASGMLLISAAGLLVPCILAIIFKAEFVRKAIADPYQGDYSRLALALSIFVPVALYLAVKWPEQRHRHFLLVALLAGLLLKLIYIGMISQEPTDDFKRMWRFTDQIAVDDLRTPQSPMERIYYERVLLYFLPLRHLLGYRELAFELGNVVVTLACSFLVYSLARMWFGKVAGQAALVVSLLAVEPIMALAVPTHDIPGTFLTLMCFGVFAVLARRLRETGWTPLLLSVACLLGLLISATDLQRRTGMVILLTCALTAVALSRQWLLSGRRRLAFAFLLLVGIPWFISLTADLALTKAGVKRSADVRVQRRLLKLSAYTEPWNDGTANHWKDWWVDVSVAPELQRQGEWMDLTISRSLTVLYRDPLSFFSMYVRKASVLFDLGSQTWIYARKAQVKSLG
ncbi:MAG TPA: hypothetical protein VLV83_22915, partial [Acidobacteriota bacterium]|nr:hypothetical protein [Acidobacteriota bacterium]